MLAEAGVPVAVCGFGLAAAGAGAAHEIAHRRPSHVILVGSAGSYDLERAPIGSALTASAVRCHGIGAGELSAGELGWGRDEIELTGSGGLVLSVAAASATLEEAAMRLHKYPQAVVEEMEGYSVALAATLWEVPVSIVRGVSNAAGDRETANWRMPEAMAAAGSMVASMLR
ncbi:MAG: futalosine hydrolase [Gaiellales bacterium]|jgi:futalosine hydrolase|nr:futalosine hydrolase [Gaiellales bacterium]